MVKSHLLSRSTLSSAIIGVVPKESGKKEGEEKTSMHDVGTAGIDRQTNIQSEGLFINYSYYFSGIVVQVTGTNWPRPAYTLLVTGLCRFRLESLAQESPYLVGIVRQLDKLPGEDLGKARQVTKSSQSRVLSNAEYCEDITPELNELMEQFREQAARLIEALDLAVPAVVRLKRLLNSLPIHSLPDVCAAIVRYVP